MYQYINSINIIYMCSVYMFRNSETNVTASLKLLPLEPGQGAPENA